MKKHASNLIVTLIMIAVVVSSMFYLYDRFIFQTFGDIKNYNYVLSYQDDHLSIDNFELYKSNDESSYGGGTMTIAHPDWLVQEGVYDLAFQVFSGKKTYDYTYSIDYSKTKNAYSLKHVLNQKMPENIEKVTFALSYNHQNIITKELKKTPVRALFASNKRYRIEGACISQYYMRLGHLVVLDKKEIMKKYDHISLEYCYQKDEEDDYYIFKKVSGTTKDMLNGNRYEVYNHDKSLGSLLKKDLSVIVVMSNEKKSKPYVFQLALSVGEAGGKNG